MGMVKKIECSKTLRSGAMLLLRCWRQMAVYTLVIWIIGVVVLAPPTSWMLDRLGAYGGDVIVGNYGIPDWLLSFSGIGYVLLAGSVLLLDLILHVTGLYWIANASIEGTLRPTKEYLVRIFLLFPSLFRFSLSIFLLCIVLVLPLGLGIGGIYLLLLRSHDINYYLSVKPPEWNWALAVGGIWSLLWIIGAGSLLLRCIYMLPAWLEGHRPFVRAFRASRNTTKRSLMPLLRVFGACLGICIVASLLLDGGSFFLTGFVLKGMTQSIHGILYILTTYLITYSLLKVVLFFLCTAWFFCVWTVCYQHLSDSADPQRTVQTISKKQESPAPLKSVPRLRFIVALSLVLLAASGVVSAWILQAEEEEFFMPPLIVAHRTGAAHAPENSLAGLEIVLEQGVSDFAEIDVQMTLDDVVVVAHDGDLMKLAGDERVIRETSYADLEDIDIGRKFHPDFEGESLGRLSEFLEMAKGRIKMMIEFKHSKDSDLVRDTVRLVREHKMQNDVLLMSLELDDVRQVQQLDANLMTGYLASVEMGDLSRLDVDFMATKNWMTTPALVKEIQGLGLPVYCWTVDDPDRVLELIELGIDGVITNDPPTVAEVIEHYRALTPVQRSLLRIRRFWRVVDELGLWRSSEPARE